MKHHAILIRTNNLQVESVPFEETERVIDQSFEKLTIDDVRAFKESVYRLPEEGYTKNCFVIRTTFITVEAQHALLKVLEEPPQVSRIVFIVAPALELLPTVLSRFHQENSSSEVSTSETLAIFQEMNLKERLETIEDKLKQKDIGWQEEIRNGLIEFLKKESVTDKSRLLDMEFVAANLLKRGSSNKMLLDQLALTLPLK